MLRAGVSANLMSLGARDFGLIVDGAVIIVENALRRLAEQQHHEGRLLSVKVRLATVAAAAREMIRPSVYGQAIIILVRLEEHTSELQTLMRSSYAAFCLKKIIISDSLEIVLPHIN